MPLFNLAATFSIIELPTKEMSAFQAGGTGWLEGLNRSTSVPRGNSAHGQSPIFSVGTLSSSYVNMVAVQGLMHFRY